jgi:two-component system, cell cycle sensor histidine kinase and response regulator CckA
VCDTLPLCGLVTMTDRSSNKKDLEKPVGQLAGDALRWSPDLAAAVFRTNPAATILSHYSDGRCLDANDAYCQLTGWSRKELIGRTTTELNVWLSVEERQRVVGELLAHGRMAGVEIRLRRKDGDLIETVAAGEVFSIGDQRYILSFFFDITARKHAQAEKLRLEGQLHHAQKMESVGRLAGGIAHDFNNMLQVILAHAQLALWEAGGSAGVREHLLEIRAAASRSVDLTRQLLAFARRQPVVPRVVNPNRIIQNLTSMLDRVIGEDIQLVWRPGQNLWNVRLDPSQFDQILANTFINARDAIAGAGTIMLETANVVVDESEPGRPPTVPPGDHVVVTISDTGGGMSEETLSHVFEPFFTTKEKGQGTGLGLATVYGIATQNGGFVTATSAPGRGSTFRIYLPRCDDQPNEDDKTPTRPAAVSSRETVLVVEDDQKVLDLVADVLAEIGYVVLRARGAREALQTAEQRGAAIALLVTDVIMPEMDGKQLSVRVAELNPGIKCLYMSGYTDNVIADHGISKDDVNFIEKPFALDAFVEKVRSVLDSQQS